MVLIPVYRSLVGVANTLTMFFKFPYKFLIGFGSGLLAMSLILFAFPDKIFNPFSFVTKCTIILKNDFIVSKSIFYKWNAKIIQDFNVHRCIDCWGNDCHLPESFKWHATPYHEWLGKFTCFLHVSCFLYDSFE